VAEGAGDDNPGVIAAEVIDHLRLVPEPFAASQADLYRS